MPESSCQYDLTGLSKLKLFWALSRTPHGLLDMCTAALGALLWLGYFPPLSVIVLGLITVFAGYTAVYALNDVVGYRSDKRKLLEGGLRSPEICSDLDAIFVRHPMAHGLLSFKAGLLWSMAWALLALTGAYILNPFCVLIFVIGCFLEAIYCFMWKISPVRTLVSGAVKTAGAVAAVYAVDPHPSLTYLIALGLMLFLWEVGGQNVPNDWADIDEDRRFNAQTIPIRLGTNWSLIIIFSTLLAAMALSLILLQLSQITFEFPFVLAFIFVGFFLLLLPAVRLYKTCEASQALILFNKSSYYPLALLVIVVLKLLL